MAVRPGETLLDRFVVETVFRGDAGSMRRLERGVQRLKARLDSASGVAMRMGAAFALPLVGIGKVAIDTDRAFRKLQAVSKFSAEEMRAFKEQAYEVGSGLPLMTAAIFDAQRSLVKLGFSFQDVLSMAPDLAKASVASAVPIEEMAKYIGVGTKNFQLALKDRTLLADQLVRIENISAANTRGVGLAFQYSGQQAANAGVRIEDYIAILGGMADAGREVEASSQGLGLFITNIQKARAGDMTRGAKMIQKVFEAINIEMSEVDAMMKSDAGLIGLMELIKERTQGDMVKLDAVLAQFGGTSYASALSGAILKLDEVKGYAAELRNAGGEAAAQIDILMDGVSGRWEEAKAMLDTVLNRMADLGASAGFQKLFEDFSKLTGWLVQVDAQGNLVNEELLRQVNATLKWGTMLLVVGVALKAISWALSGFLIVLKAVGYAWAGLRAVLGVIPALLRGIGVALRLLTGPIGWLLTAAYYTAKWSGALDQIKSDWAAWVDSISAIDWLSVPAGIADGFRQAWADITADWTEWKTQFLSEWTAWVEGLAEKWGAVIGKIAGVRNWLSEKLGGGDDESGEVAGNIDVGAATAVDRAMARRHPVGAQWLAANLRNAAAPPQVGPTAQDFESLRAGAAAGSAISRDVSVQVEKIEVNSPNANPKEVAAEVGHELSRQLRVVVDQADSNVAG